MTTQFWKFGDALLEDAELKGVIAYFGHWCLQAKGREAIRGSNIVPALVSVLQTGSMEAKAGAAGALANLSCESQSVRLIRRSSGILPLLDLVQCVLCTFSLALHGRLSASA